MVATVLVATAILALLHLYYFEGKSGKVDFVYFFVLIAVMGLNSANVDLSRYEEIYNQVAGSDSFFEALKVFSDKGYVLLNWLSSAGGLEFAEFHFLCYLFLLVAVFYVAKGLGAPICVIYLIYLTYPMFMDAIQLRNFAISVIFLTSIYCFAHNTFRWYGIGLVSILFSISIQPLALLFLPFIAFYHVYNSKRFGKLPYIFIIFGLLTPALKKIVTMYWTEIVSLMNLVSTIFSRGEKYVGNQIYDSRLFKIYLVVIIFTYILYRLEKYLLSLNEVSELQKKFVKLSFVSFLYLICWMPLFMLSLDFATRLPRIFFLLAYMVIGIYVQHCRRKSEKWGIIILTIFIAFFYGLVDLYISSSRFNVENILDNNFLL